MDARRQVDDMAVSIKTVEKDCDEIRIAQFLTTLHDPQNHCVPIIDVLPDPLNPRLCLFVMPFLRRFNDPEFRIAGDVIDFVDQTLEVRQHKRESRVYHNSQAISGSGFLA